MKTILQVPIDSKTLALARKAAEEMGFSSIQECLRLFMQRLAEGKVEIKFIIKGET